MLLPRPPYITSCYSLLANYALHCTHPVNLRNCFSAPCAIRGNRRRSASRARAKAEATFVRCGAEAPETSKDLWHGLDPQSIFGVILRAAYNYVIDTIQLLVSGGSAQGMVVISVGVLPNTSY